MTPDKLLLKIYDTAVLCVHGDSHAAGEYQANHKQNGEPNLGGGLFVLMGTLENATNPKLLANTAKHLLLPAVVSRTFMEWLTLRSQ